MYEFHADFKKLSHIADIVLWNRGYMRIWTFWDLFVPPPPHDKAIHKGLCGRWMQTQRGFRRKITALYPVIHRRVFSGSPISSPRLE